MGQSLFSCDLFVPMAQFPGQYQQRLVYTEAVALRARGEECVRLAVKAKQGALALHGTIVRVTEAESGEPVRVGPPRHRERGRAS